MIITAIHIYQYSIPIEPFVIATGTMHFAQNMLIRIHTNEGIVGIGECSAFPMIAGETQDTCIAVAKDFAKIWLQKNALSITDRIAELHTYIDRNFTAKSAFDMALYDVNAQHAALPLYKFLNPAATLKTIETDLTIGIDTPENMAVKARNFVANGVTKIKIKVGKNAKEDVERIKLIRSAAGADVLLRIDANQGWSFEDACYSLQLMEQYHIQFCEQPIHKYNNYLLPQLKAATTVPIMVDESVFNDIDLQYLLPNGGFDYVNIKFAKCGGFHNAVKINALAEQHRIPCMIGGMLETRVAMTAFAHFAQASNNVQFFDMDTALLGHLIDPVIGGANYNGYHIYLPTSNGLGVNVSDEFLASCNQFCIS